jgi:hypothetical protein
VNFHPAHLIVADSLQYLNALAASGLALPIGHYLLLIDIFRQSFLHCGTRYLQCYHIPVGHFSEHGDC